MINQQKSFDPVIITSHLGDILNIPTRSKLIISMLKYFIHEKQQIPYAYEHLKNVSMSATISKMKEQEGIFARHKISKLKRTFEEFELVFKELGNELEKNNVEEVALLLGATIYSPKDILRIQVPGAIQSFDSLHVPKIYFTVLRSLLNSQQLDQLLNQPIGLTNIYIFIKTIDGCKSDFFLPKERFTLSNKCRQATINMLYRDDILEKNTLPLSPRKTNISVFSDSTTSDNSTPNQSLEENTSTLQLENPIEWFQSKIIIKGFK